MLRASELVDLVGTANWTEFLKFVETGEASPAFLEVLRTSPSCQQAVERAFQAQADAFAASFQQADEKIHAGRTNVTSVISGRSTWLLAEGARLSLHRQMAGLAALMLLAFMGSWALLTYRGRLNISEANNRTSERKYSLLQEKRTKDIQSATAGLEGKLHTQEGLKEKYRAEADSSRDTELAQGLELAIQKDINSNIEATAEEWKSKYALKVTCSRISVDAAAITFDAQLAQLPRAQTSIWAKTLGQDFDADPRTPAVTILLHRINSELPLTPNDVPPEWSQFREVQSQLSRSEPARALVELIADTEQQIFGMNKGEAPSGDKIADLLARRATAQQLVKNYYQVRQTQLIPLLAEQVASRDSEQGGVNEYRRAGAAYALAVIGPPAGHDAFAVLKGAAQDADKWHQVYLHHATDAAMIKIGHGPWDADTKTLPSIDGNENGDRRIPTGK